MTAIGTVHLERWHSQCPGCLEVGFVADGRLGLGEYLTVRARRMACMAGLNKPFRKAEVLLRELSGWSVDAEAIRRLTHAEAKSATESRSRRQRLPQEFVQASGAITKLI